MGTSGDDYIPGGEAGFKEWIDTFMDILINVIIPAIGANAPPAGETADLQTKYNTFTADYALGRKTNTQRTKQQKDDKNDAKADVEAEVRLYVKNNLAFKKYITHGMRDALSIPTHDTVRTHQNPPTAGFEMEFDYRKGGHIDLKFLSEAVKGKPDGVFGFKLFYKIGGDAPSPADCDKTALGTKAIYTLSFVNTYAGQKVYCYGCWLNEKLEEGPLSPMFTMMVPL